MLVIHTVGLLMVIGMLGSTSTRSHGLFGFFRKMFVMTYGSQPTSPAISTKSGGIRLNSIDPADTSTSRDPGNNPPPPPPIP